jgi:hypothetical protein
MNTLFPYYYTFSEMPDTRHQTQEKVDYYYKLYFSLKKRKDISRKRKTRLMKEAEKEWQLWKGLQEWEKEIYS